MQAVQATNDHGPARRPAWREWEMLLLVLLVGGAYFTRLDHLPIRGDESNWSVVAEEMLASGDWIVPRRQQQPFPDRPPLNSWCIALSSLALGHWNPIAIRLPSVLAVLATTLGLYVYSRMYLSRVGALAAAAAFATMGHELIHGRMAETDNVLTFCVAGSLLCWSAGYLRGWSPVRTWLAGYALAALGTLAKGPQAPVYFVGAVVCFLTLRRDWRYLLSWQHLTGMLAYAAILGAWLVPFYWQTDWASVVGVWSEEGHLSSRFDYSNLPHALGHLVTFPIGLFAAMLPWSPLLLAYASRWLRQSLGEARPYAQFLGVCWLVSFPTVWLSPVSGPRYILSMYPAAAALAGIVLERCWQSSGATFWQRCWSRFLTGGACLAVVAGIAVAACGRLIHQRPMADWRQPDWFAAVYLLAACLGAALFVWARRGLEPLRAKVGILTAGGLMSLTFTGVVLTATINKSYNPALEVAELRTRLPSDVRLVSLGPVHHRFAYYYQAPVELLDWSAQSAELPPEIDFFCVTQYEDLPIELPFEWERIGAVSCDRAPRGGANRVVVGRRVPAAHEPSAEPDPRARRPIMAAEKSSSILR